MVDNNKEETIELCGELVVLTEGELLEPHKYFKVIKNSTRSIKTGELERELDAVSRHIEAAQSIGQANFLAQLKFAYETIIKEKVLILAGYTRYMRYDDIEPLTAKSKNVKLIELSDYPRAIPEKNIMDIKDAQDLGLFDRFLVIFTDYTDNDYKTEKQKKEIARNRDPIVVGYFKTKDNQMKSPRVYLITDWEDDYCDLTFDKFIEGQAEMVSANGLMEHDHDYLQRLLKDSVEMGDQIHVIPVSTTQKVLGGIKKWLAS